MVLKCFAYGEGGSVFYKTERGNVSMLAEGRHIYYSKPLFDALRNLQEFLSPHFRFAVCSKNQSLSLPSQRVDS